jgi:hypothetical protein
MKLLVFGSCVLFLGLPARAQTDLKSDLLSHASSGQVSTHLTGLEEKTHEPSMLAVDLFAAELTTVLKGRTLRDADAATLVREIDAIFKSAGTSTIGFLEHVANFKAALTSIGVPRLSADDLGQRLEKIGRQVRGPDDTPVDLGPPRRQFR